MRASTAEHYEAAVRDIQRHAEACRARAPRAFALSECIQMALWGDGCTGTADDELVPYMTALGSAPEWEYEENEIPDELIGALWREAMAREAKTKRGEQ